LTQSQNVSAKLALCVDELFQNQIESYVQSNNDWNELKGTVMHTMYEVFLFRGHSYFFRMFDILVKHLIPTGVMKNLVETHFNKKWKFEKVMEGPKVLSLSDLMFGFKIWLVCCIFPFLTFICEIMYRFLRPLSKYWKMKFGKVHPLEDVEIDTKRVKLNSALIKEFRTKSIVNQNLDISEFDRTKINSLQKGTVQESTDMEEKMLPGAIVAHSALDHSKTGKLNKFYI